VTPPLFEAIGQHDAERVAALLEQGEDPDGLQPEPPGWRPLHAAIEELEYGASIELLVLLLRAGASVDGWDDGRSATPLLMAAFREQAEALRLLLGAGADPNVRGDEGDTPLRVYVERRERETVALLLRCGARRTIDDAGGPTGMNALGLAASALDGEMVDLLLAHGADPHALDLDRRTAADRLPAPDGTDRAVWAAVKARLSG
jgi:ankyrin repeat protein